MNQTPLKYLVLAIQDVNTASAVNLTEVLNTFLSEGWVLAGTADSYIVLALVKEPA